MHQETYHAALQESQCNKVARQNEIIATLQKLVAEKDDLLDLKENMLTLMMKDRNERLQQNQTVPTFQQMEIIQQSTAGPMTKDETDLKGSPNERFAQPAWCSIM